MSNRKPTRNSKNNENKELEALRRKIARKDAINSFIKHAGYVAGFLAAYGAAAYLLFFQQNSTLKIAAIVIAIVSIVIFIRMAKERIQSIDKRSTKSERRTGILLACLYITISIATIAVPAAIITGRNYFLSRFDTVLSQYAFVEVTHANFGSSPTQLHGKAIIIDSQGKIDSNIYFGLPKELVAQNPEEVSIVVIADRFGSETGEFVMTHNKTYDYYYRVEVIDIASRKIIYDDTDISEFNINKYLTSLLRNEYDKLSLYK